MNKSAPKKFFRNIIVFTFINLEYNIFYIILHYNYIVVNFEVCVVQALSGKYISHIIEYFVNVYKNVLIYYN